MPEHRRLGIVVALADEARALGLGRLRPGQLQELPEIGFAHLSGMGPQAARQGGEALLAAGASVLLSVGTAGALHPELRAGDLCVPAQILWEGRPYGVAQAWRARFLDRCSPTGNAALLSVSAALADPRTKAAAAEQAVAVDMESGALAALAQEKNVPFFALRVIVDSVDTPLPDAVLQGVDPYGRPRWPRFLWHLLRRPQQLPALLRLGHQMQKARKTLGWIGMELGVRDRK